MKIDEKNTNLSNKLLAYSLSAGAFLIASQDVNAQIWGSSVNKVIPTDGLSLDINFGGGLKEYTLQFGTNGSFYYYSFVNLLGYNNANRYIPGNSGITGVVDGGTLINSSSPWSVSASGVVMYKLRNFGNFMYGSGYTADNKYIGVKFVDGTNTRYGWIRVKITSTVPFRLTVYDYAYETTGSSITCNGVLPVELSAFNANCVSNGVSLDWTTATEINNLGFEIERNKYPDFEKGESTSLWEKIGFVEGHGNSNATNDYTFLDANAPKGLVMYRLKQLDADGAYEYSEMVTVENNIAMDFQLMQNYPNPFNPVTTIKYSIPNENNVTIKVYDMLGSEITTLINENKPAGSYEIQFDGSNLASGTYLYKIEAGDFTATKKLMLIK